MHLQGFLFYAHQILIHKKAGTSNTINLYQKEFRLFFCSLYARTTVGFLFVTPNPVFKPIDQKALFRYAPSYSVLLKGFNSSRKNIKYHTFLDPGIGLNFSAQDFNYDEAIELGIGLVATVFKDFIQSGYGVNTFSGRGYGLFRI